MDKAIIKTFRNGRFRRGKKAFKHLPFTRNGKEQKLAYRYVAWKECKFTLESKIFMTMLVQRQAKLQVALIASQPRPIHEPAAAFIAMKALKIAQLTIDTAESIANIWNKPVKPIWTRP